MIQNTGLPTAINDISMIQPAVLGETNNCHALLRTGFLHNICDVFGRNDFELWSGCAGNCEPARNGHPAWRPHVVSLRHRLSMGVYRVSGKTPQALR